MVVEPFFLDSHKATLYTVVYLPDNVADLTDFFILCHPLFEEKKSTHRLFVELARTLSTQGYGVALMDFSGCGDSSGDLADFTVGDWLRDLDQLTAHLSGRLTQCRLNFNLIGVRFGASLACLYAGKNSRCRRLILVDPVMQGSVYFREIMKRKLVREMMTFGQSGRSLDTMDAELNEGKALDLDGVAINKSFHTRISKIDCQITDFPQNIQILLIQQSPGKELLPMYETFYDHVVQKQIKISSDCLTVPPFWKAVDVADHQRVMSSITTWLSTPVDSNGKDRPIHESR